MNLVDMHYGVCRNTFPHDLIPVASFVPLVSRSLLRSDFFVRLPDPERAKKFLLKKVNRRENRTE